MALVSCDTFVALADVVEGGAGVVFGKNSDRPSGEVQEVVHVSGEEHGEGEKVQCTYIAIPQVAVTLSTVLSKPAWMWGAEMGVNEANVAIGNEAIWTRMSNNEEDLKPRLLGMDLLRNISNCLSIRTKIDREHPDLRAFLVERGWWDGKEEFDWAKTMGSSSETQLETPNKRFDCGKKLLRQFAAHGTFSVRNMMSVLRDEESGICRSPDSDFPTAGSQVSLLGSKSVNFFTATSDPQRSVFKPLPSFHFLKRNSEPQMLSAHTRSPQDDGEIPDRQHRLWALHHQAEVAVAAQIDELLRRLEERGLNEAQTLTNERGPKVGLEEDGEEGENLFDRMVGEEMKLYSDVIG